MHIFKNVKCKWFLVGTHHPPSQNDHYFFENLDKVIDYMIKKIESCITFDEVFMKVLNRHTSLKKKILRANHSPYMSKTLKWLSWLK